MYLRKAFAKVAIRVLLPAALFLAHASAGFSQTFNRIQFVIGTSDDDLRNDSSATATLIGTNGAALQTITLKAQNAGTWNNNTTNTVVAPLTVPRTRDSISRIQISFASHKSGFESDDNWNIQSVAVTLSNNGAAPVTLVTGGAQRLSASVPSYTLTPPAVAVSGAFNQIQFVIGTGTDDLRDDSSAVAVIQSPAGVPLQTLTLKQQNAPGWKVNSSTNLTLGLNPALLPSAIGSIVISMTSHKSLTENNDTWNLQSAAITLLNNGSSPQSMDECSRHSFCIVN